MKKVSITTRITGWYTIFMVIITVALLAFVIHAGNLQASVVAKNKLTEHVADASEEIVSYGENFIIDSDLVYYEDGVYLSIYDNAGNLIEGRRPIELATLPPLEDKIMHKMYDTEGEIWYVYDSHFDLEGESVWVRGISKDFAEQSLFAFTSKIAGFALPGLVLVAAFGGFVITRRGLKPLRRVVETAEEITKDGNLSRRIDFKGTAAANDEIYDLIVTYNEMFDKLQDAFEKEKQFTSDVSHELRTPLAVIISQSDYAKSDPEYMEKALDVINREAKRMSSLVNKLLTLSRSDAGRLKLENVPIEFSEMCELVALQQESLAEDRGQRIIADIEPDIMVTGDDSMLIRVLLNLTENAMKYGRNGGTIKMTLKSEGEYAHCSVADDGIGIAEEHLDKIWERFYRVDSSRTEEGSGLGLSMVDALVKAHGGYVDVQSNLGEGSVFNVYLPINRD